MGDLVKEDTEKVVYHCTSHPIPDTHPGLSTKAKMFVVHELFFYGQS